MSKKSVLQREKKRKILCEKYLSKRLFIKSILKSKKINNSEKIKYNYQLQRMPLNSNPCRRRKRCFISGRPRGYIGYFGLSRICLREKIMNCEIFGVTKSSW
ncbi:30S ribosomal protein S14 [Candidatus Vidania fulgoroideorum]